MKKRSSDASAGTNATWSPTPSNGQWNTPGNWTGGAVATGTATFGASSATSIVFAPKSTASVDAIVFAAGAPSYLFTFVEPSPTTPTLTIGGAGVTNNSSNPQHFVVAASATGYKNAQLAFRGSATAGGSNVVYAAGPTDQPNAPGGGVIGFNDNTTAGSASFIVTAGPGDPTTGVRGGELTFNDSSSGDRANFTIHGSTSTVIQGDTFANVVFRAKATAANATFTNVGATLPGCDGGNTQFYETATAATAVFTNLGASVAKGNGGDCAFDGTSNAGTATFHNYPSTAVGGNGGVTSFNNNGPAMLVTTQGASAAKGTFHNHGATVDGQGGGHTYFETGYGSPTAASGTFINHGTTVATTDTTSPGRTVFSIYTPQKTLNFVASAGNGTFINLPGAVAGALGGYTEFLVYGGTVPNGPTAATAQIVNIGGLVAGAAGGQTIFSGTPTTAGSAQIIAFGGTSGGFGGTIVFKPGSSGGTSSIGVIGNGTLDASQYAAPSLTFGTLVVSAGTVKVSLGTVTTNVVLSAALQILAGPLTFVFVAGTGFTTNATYTILTAPNLSSFTSSQFTGNALNGAAAVFSIVGNQLRVTFTTLAKKPSAKSPAKSPQKSPAKSPKKAVAKKAAKKAPKR